VFPAAIAGANEYIVSSTGESGITRSCASISL
jgi:hypothetical protein